VVEQNNGGDWLPALFVETHPEMRGLVRTVHASKGKMARAEPVAALYDDGKVCHAEGLGELEEEMQEWAPADSKWSPGRIDAMVWGVEYHRGAAQMPIFAMV
jgi:phage terminase large subunit-like protein